MLPDPENPVVKRCALGMEQESLGHAAAAAEYFREAWALAATPQEKAIAAHYMARQETEAAAVLDWNERALAFARLQPDEAAIAAFLPSLLLNVAKSHEDLGKRGQALDFYRQALQQAQKGSGPYTEMIRSGIQAGLQRLDSGRQIAALETLIDAWCARRDLRALAAVLPAYLAAQDPQSPDTLGRALAYLHAMRHLPGSEQAQLSSLLRDLSVDTSG